MITTSSVFVNVKYVKYIAIDRYKLDGKPSPETFFNLIGEHLNASEPAFLELTLKLYRLAIFCDRTPPELQLFLDVADAISESSSF
jgi:hypothetical protein